MKRLVGAAVVLATACWGSATIAPTTMTSLPGPVPNSSVSPAGFGELSTCVTPPARVEGSGWEDGTEELGLVEPLTGMRVHAAAWGDVDQDGRLDLAVGTFADRPAADYRVRGAEGPSPDRLLYGGDPFTPVDLDDLGRTSGAVMADLDGDVDLDLVLIRNAGLAGRSDLVSRVFRNVDGSLESAAELPLPAGFQGRSVVAFPLDGDDDLDLAVVEDVYGAHGLRVLRNEGGLLFDDVTGAVGIPDGVYGLGVAAADLTGDGLVDLVVGGDPRVMVGTPSGRFRVVEVDALAWRMEHPEDLAGGVAVGDVDGDGRFDLAVGQHFGRADRNAPIPVRLYLNRATAGVPDFEEVTFEAGLPPLPTKAPHVEFADFDNDGLLDLLTSSSTAGGDRPLLFANLGTEAGIPRFRALDEPGDSQYWVTAPVADVDRDGRLDVFLGEWNPGLPSRLLFNRRPAGGWLQVEFRIPGRGVGSVVEVTDPDRGILLGRMPVTAGSGYGGGSETAVHFGLGDVRMAEVSVLLPDARITATVASDRRVVLGGCG